MSNIISGPIGQILVIIVVLVVYSIIAGAINGWFIQTIDAGVVASERFDRVILKTSGDASADERWGKVANVSEDGFLVGGGAGAHNPSSTTAFVLTKDGDNCKVGTLTGYVHATTTAPAILANQTYYTPAGTEVASSAASVAGKSGSANPPVVVTIDNCKWKESAKVLQAGGLGQVVTIVLQAAGLALPVAILTMVGGFGGSLMSRVGGTPLMRIVTAVVIVVLAAILFSYFVPFVDSAYQSIDPNRMVIYDSGLGSLGVVVGNFWGVALVAGMMSIGWSLVAMLRGGGNMLSGGGGRQRM